MDKIKIFAYNKMVNLKNIYKSFEIRYDVRAARKLLGLPKTTPKTQVNKALRNLYHEIAEETYQPIYQYTLSGRSQDIRDVKIRNISFTFQSKKQYDMHPMNISNKTNDKGNGLPTYTYGNTPERFEAFLEPFISDVTGGHTHYFELVIDKISKRKLPKKGKQLKDVPLFNAVVNLPYKEFNGFKDSGEMMCVPETILHHLQSNGKNKKLTVEKVIAILEEVYVENEDEEFVKSDRFKTKEVIDYSLLSMEEKYQLYYKRCKDYEDFLNKESDDDDSDGESECPDEEYGKRGYTPQDIIRTLEHYKCRGRLVDIHQNQFLTTNFDLKYDKNLKSFCGMVYNSHLYYCDDHNFISSISCNRNNSCLHEQVYEKKVKEFENKNIYEIIEANDLTDCYIDMFKSDNTIRLVKTKNGKISNILYDDNKSISANPEKTIMQEILGDKFQNENTTILGEKEFKEFFPTHKCSQFTKDVFDNLQKHGNIVESFNEPVNKIQFEYDINKCRTHCWMNNKLGDYELFGVSCQIEDYKGSLTHAGIYYVELKSVKDREFFMRGNTWYSKQYIEIGLQEGYQVSIKYQLLATETLEADYFKKFVKHIVEKYPNHFKHIINKCIGYRGKTNTTQSKGYIETDFEMAVAAFWDNNEDQIGFIDEENIDKKKWKMMKGKLCNIHNLKVDENTTHYIVEFNEFKTMYENDLPIFNKILENEYLNVYHLKKSLGGRLIKIKTDAVVVEGKHNKIQLSNEIGGIKFSKEFDVQVNIKEVELNSTYNVDTSMNWNVTLEQEDMSVSIPTTGSYLVTGLGGFGKSFLIKQQVEYSEISTLRLAFTNIATENISDESHPANTLNSYFGINCNTGKCTEKKLKNLKNIKTIIISEVFMTPSYIMGHLSKIKHLFPHIKFICEGDPEQTRPVGEESINWLETKLLFNLCDGNMVKLTVNKRNKETDNYYKILDGKELCSSKFSNRNSQQINVCRTNAMRVTINDELMDKENGVFIAKNKKNKYSQDIWLTLDTPVMCVKTDKKLGIKNGKFYHLKEIESTKIRFEEKSIELATFAEHFVVAYAITNHKIQGLTIKESFNIYEWIKMTRREQYTAYSRTSDGDTVKINVYKKPNYDLWNELQRFFYPNYCVYAWTSSKCNDIYIGHTKNFNERKKEHLRDVTTNDNDLYKKMRETGIESWTMQIIEEFYAYDRSEAIQYEQKHIDNYRSNLNMLRAYNIKI